MHSEGMLAMMTQRDHKKVDWVIDGGQERVPYGEEMLLSELKNIEPFDNCILKNLIISPLL